MFDAIESKEEQETIADCYSYYRWSSDRQEEGSTLARQMKCARKIAKRYNLNLIEEFSDHGVSAYKGKNRKEKLGQFIEEVKSGKIAKGSWLVVENLDRLSRENVLSALSLFTDILELGITIVTGMDERVYTEQSVQDNPMDLMQSIMHFAVAHSESVKKSERTNEHATIFIEKFLAGEQSSDGFPVAVRSVGQNEWWVDCSDGFVRPHPEYIKAVKDIIRLTIEGMGSYQIVDYLNEHYPIPPRKRKLWGRHLVSKLFTKRTLLGEKKVTVEGVEYLLEGYYPKLLTEDQFNQIRAIKKGRRSFSDKVTNVPLLSGIRILKCGHCGGNMYAFTHRRKNLRYICGTGQNNQGCRPWTFSATWAEDTVLRLGGNHIFRPRNLNEDIDIILSGLREELVEKEQMLDQASERIFDEDMPDSVMNKVKALGVEVVEIKAKIKKIEEEKQYQFEEGVDWDKADPRALTFSEFAIRADIKNRIKLSIERVTCTQVGRRHIRFRILFKNGRTIMADRTSSALAFDGGAWVKVGDYYGSQVRIKPVKDQPNYLPVTVEDEFSQSPFIAPPAECVGSVYSYHYNGLYDLSDEMAKDFMKGKASRQVEGDIKRADHLINWASDMPGAPKIIEDQYQVFKHPVKKRVIKKPKPEIHYVTGARFKSDYVPAWQR